MAVTGNVRYTSHVRTHWYPHRSTAPTMNCNDGVARQDTSCSQLLGCRQAYICSLWPWMSGWQILHSQCNSRRRLKCFTFVSGQANISQVNLVSIEQYVHWTKCQKHAHKDFPRTTIKEVDSPTGGCHEGKKVLQGGRSSKHKSSEHGISIEQYVHSTKWHLNKCVFAISQLNNVSIEHNLRV